MANLYVRIHNFPPSLPEGPGTVVAMGLGTAALADSTPFRDFVDRYILSIEELDPKVPEAFVCRDERGRRVAEREVVLRPQLHVDQVLELERIIQTSSNPYGIEPVVEDKRHDQSPIPTEDIPSALLKRWLNGS